MAGRDILQGALPVEYIEETNFASFEDEADWNWWGVVTSWDVDQGVESESVTYLPEQGANNRLEKRVNVSHREMWEGSIAYHPQGWDELQYWTGSVGGTSDTITSVQVGEVDENNDEYRRIAGGVGEEVTVSIEEDGIAEIDGSFIFADGEDFTTTDHTSDQDSDGTSGSHAAEDATEPFAYKDLSNVQLGGSDLSGAVESIEFTVSNDLSVVRDPDSSNDTLIDAIVPMDREITVDLDITYEDFSMLDSVRSYQKQDLTFDVGTTSFTINDVQFPEAPYEFSPDDLISDSLSSDPCSGISWS